MTTASQTVRLSSAAARDGRRVLRLLGRCAATTSLAVLALVALLLLTRRWCGAPLTPLPLGAAALTAGLAAMLAFAARWAWFDREAAPTAALFSAAWLPPGGTLMLLGVAITLPGMSVAAQLAVWGMIVLEEGAALAWLWRQRAGETRPDSPADRRSDLRPAMVAAPPMDSPLGSPSLGLLEEEADLPDEVTQCIVRRATATGGETVDALVRGNFAPQQRALSLHLNFCPPLAVRPEVEVESISGPANRVQELYVQPFGVRIDLRLSRAEGAATSVVLRVVATAEQAAID